jgi:hypothetical protein
MTSHSIPFRGLALRALFHVGVYEIHWFGTDWLIRWYLGQLEQDEVSELIRRCKAVSGKSSAS